MLQNKTKIQAIVLTGIIGLVFIFMSVILYLFYSQSNEKNLEFEQRIQSAEHSALVDLDHYLSKRLEAILSSEAILKAFQNRDREQLYRLIQDRYRIINSELPGSVTLLFCTPDMVVLLRAHHPDHYNDNVRAIRPMVAKVNHGHQITRGFEVGKHEVNYRVATPVTYQDQYLGVIEIGTGVEYIMESINNHFSLPAALYLNPEYLVHYEKDKGAATISGHHLFISNDLQLFSNLDSLELITKRKIAIDNKWYRIHAHNPITNFQGKEIGTLVFLQNIDQEHTLLIKTAAGSIFLSLLILALVWTLLNKFTGKIIDNLITSEKRARQDEEELKKFKIIFDNVNYGVASVDMDGMIIDINKYFAAIHGYKVPELQGRHVSVFHSDEQIEVVEKINRKCLKDGSYNGLIVMHKHRDGSLFPMEMNGVVINDEQGNPLFLVGMAIDITKRVQLEEKLKDHSDHLEVKVALRTEELTAINERLQHEIKERLGVEKSLLKNQYLLQSIVDNSPTFIFSKDLRGKYSLINNRFEELLGRERHEIIGKTIIGKTAHDLFPKEIADSFLISDRKVLDNKTTIQIEHLLPLKDGLHTYITSKFPIYDDKGTLYGLAGISTDITDRKKLEEDLSMFKVFTESSSEGMGWADIDGKIIYINSALTQLFGEKDTKALLGKSIAGCYPDYEQQRLREEIFPIVLKEGSWSGELMIQQTNGKLIPTQNSLFLISNEALEPIFYANIVTDIAERRKTEKDLNIFKSFAESSNQGMGWTSMDGEIVYANPAGSELFGEKDQKALIGKNVITTYYPMDEQQKLIEEVMPALVKNGSWSGELMIQQTNGKLIPTHNSFFLISNEALEPMFCANIVTDITERKKIEKDLNIFKSFAESSNQGMGWTSMDGAIVYINPAMSELFGEKDPKALLGKNVITTYYSDDEQQRLTEEILPDLIKNGTWSGELMLQQANGKLIPTHNSLFLISNEVLKPMFCANIVIDISELKQGEERIKQSLHEKNVLLKEIHHRVKNNLQVASSMLYLQAKEVGDEGLREVLLNSRDRIKSMGLVHEALYQSEDLSRIDFAQYIQTLVKHVFRTYKNRSKRIIPKINIENIGLNIEAAIPCGLIINELVTNSFKHGFSEKNGEIRINMIKEEDHFVLTVSDNGTGFPEDMDFRNRKSVGLQLVTSLVKQLNGTIELRRNHGTEFTIIFTEPTYSPRV